MTDARLAASLRMAAIMAAGLAAGGCISWQGAYDSAAVRECRRHIDMNERRACLAAAEANAQAQRRAARNDPASPQDQVTCEGAASGPPP